MKNIFDAEYRKEYLEGQALGANPKFEFQQGYHGEAFSSGFFTGRLSYETKNGILSQGIPEKILTDQVLDDFLLDGMLNIRIDLRGYTLFQQRVIMQWYDSGVEKHDLDEGIYLFAFLESIGIVVS